MTATHCNTLQHTATQVIYISEVFDQEKERLVLVIRIIFQCVAVCCSVLQCVAGVLQVCCKCVAVCCSVLQCVAVYCSVLQCIAVCFSALQCVALCCNVLQCVTACCSVLQCAAACVAVIYLIQSPCPGIPPHVMHCVVQCVAV